MKKILSLLLAVMMLVSILPVAYASEPGGNWGSGTTVEYDANDKDGDGVLDNLDYTITVPAKLAPGGSGTVTLAGMWPSDATVKVTADASVDLVNSINAADTKNLAVTFAGIEKAGNNTERKSYDETVSVADISAALFGTWSGKFNYNVDYVAGSGNTGGSTGGDSGTTEPSDPDTGDEDANLPQFALSNTDTKYTYEEGMTWAEWVESEYNTDGFVIIDGEIRTDDGEYRITNANFESIAPNAKIKSLLYHRGY